jgi:glutamate synthase (NADPH/NADH) small chain
VLHSTNNFPEFTGRICPAPCEAACTLNIIDQPVTIKSIECAIVDKGWDNGWITAQVPAKKTGKSVAVVGWARPVWPRPSSWRAGHSVTVFEKNDRIGGLLRYGIPDFKMEKHLINRRMVQMEAEGVAFRTSVEVGVHVSVAALKTLTPSCWQAVRKIRVRSTFRVELPGVRFAMEFLTQQNKRVAGDDEIRAAPRGSLTATGKHVVVIGGGDTAATAWHVNRQGALSVTQLEIMPEPPEKENKAMSWPNWPLKLRTSSSHEEGVAREFAVLTKRCVGENGSSPAWNASASNGKAARWSKCRAANSRSRPTSSCWPWALSARASGSARSGRRELDARGNVKADTNTYRTSDDKIFACGDMRLVSPWSCGHP